jgi:hypothetical protein
MIMKVRIRLLLLVFPCLAGVFSGCGDTGGSFNPNMPPDTYLSGKPPTEQPTSYRVTFNWYGTDEDGIIEDFYFAVDDTSEDAWTMTSTKDTTLVFSASDFADTNYENRTLAYHSFHVKAIDNEGAVDPTPANAYFTAFTILPDTRLTGGPGEGSVVATNVTFSWIGSDLDGIISGYKFWLIRDAQGELPADTVAMDSVDFQVESRRFENLKNGNHTFIVQSVDDANAKDPTPVQRHFQVNDSFKNPLLYINTNILGDQHRFKGFRWPSQYDSPVGVFLGETLEFDWFAETSYYGGELVGYRFALDDTTQWPAWSIYSTRFPVDEDSVFMPSVGRHSLFVEAKDDVGGMTRGRIFFEVIDPTFEGPILIIDDFQQDRNWPDFTPDGVPFSGLQTAFYDSIYSAFEHEILTARVGTPSVFDLAETKFVHWYCGSQSTVLDRIIHESDYNPLGGYLRIGGNMILEGERVCRALAGFQAGDYPFNFGETSFANEWIKITAAYSGSHVATGFAGALSEGVPGFEQDLPVDLEHFYKWGAPYDYFGWEGMTNTEAVDAVESAEVLYTYDCTNQYSHNNCSGPNGLNGRPCIVRFPADGSLDGGNVVFCTFHLYFLYTLEVKDFVTQVLLDSGFE